MKVLIAGGGIGGLAAALSLHQVGIQVCVFESVSTPGPVGAGINLRPVAVRELFALGLEKELMAAGIAPQASAYFTKFGKLVFKVPLGLAAGYGWPQCSIHRGRLFELLHGALVDRIGVENIRTGHHLHSFEQDGDGVTAHFVDRATDEKLCMESGDALVAADGIHSIVREALYPGQTDPVFAGIMMYRGITQAKPFLDGHTTIVVGHLRRKIVSYPLSEELDDEGRTQINWIAELPLETDRIPLEDWNRTADKDEFLPEFASYRFDWLDVPQLLDGANVAHVFPKVDRQPVSRWSFGRVTLLGDAAHPMHPAGGQGGSQAIVDARYLARAFLTERDPETALKRYEAERIAEVNRIVLSSRNMTPEQILRLVEERAPEGYERREDVISDGEIASLAGAFLAATNTSAESVNSKPSVLEGLVPLAG